MKKKSRTGCILALLLTGAAFALLVAVLLAVGVRAYLDSPRQVSGFDFGEPVPQAYQLSNQQIELIQKDGYPQSFSILFYRDRDVNDQFETIRFEEWSYPNLGWSYVFENGDLISKDGIERVSTLGTVYRPEAFNAFINRKQVASAGGLDEWTILPVEKELVEDADLYYAEGLTFGLESGKLVFIEAFGYESDAPLPDLPEEPAAQAPPANALTPEEAAAQGTYPYSVLYFIDGSLDGCGEISVEMSFEGNTLRMLENEDPLELVRVAEDTFVSDDNEIPITLLFTPTGYTWSMTEDDFSFEFYAFRKLPDEAQAISDPGLSQEETLSQGTHAYQVDFCQAGEVYFSDQTTLTLTFPEGALEIVEAAGPDIYYKAGTNFYIDDEESDFDLFFTDFGFLWRIEEDGGDDFVVFMIQE